jgi:hypothetical protein
MNRFPTIAHKLKTIFNVNHGLSEDVAIRLYKQAAASANGEMLRNELREAFSDPQFSWKQMLRNPECEVLDADTEEEARAYARRILWAPLFDDR